jgi:hypothetical protein
MRGRMAVAGLAALAAGCLANAGGPNTADCGGGQFLGSFNGVASGAMADTLTGCAFFAIEPATRSFGLVLTNGGPGSRHPMIKVLSATLPRGTRVVGDEFGQLSGVMFLGPRTFAITGGSLMTGAVTQVRPDGSIALDGLVDLTATDSLGATLAISGSFIGQCVGATEDAGRGDGLKQVPEACKLPAAAIRLPR